jgi:hypothetical protein
LENLFQTNSQSDPATILAELLVQAKPLIDTITPTSLELGLVTAELHKVHLPDILRQQLCGQLASRLKVPVDSLRGIGTKQSSANLPAYATDPDPWPDPVDGDSLLREISILLRSVVVVDNHSLIALTFWSLLTYLSDAVETLALLVALSPTKRCGKTRLLTALSHLVRQPLYCIRPTAAVVYRTIGKYEPTFLVDEADTLFNDAKGQENAELREVFCAGFNRDVYVPRCVGDNHEVENFPTWCPKAIGLNGKLPDQLYDRAIPLKLQRKTKAEVVTPLRQIPPDRWLELRRKLARVAQDLADQVRTANPIIPNGLNDRAEDAWLPLLAIAEVVGGNWPTLVRTAALSLTSDTDDQEPFVIQLMAALKAVYEDAGMTDPDDFLPTAHLIAELNKDEEAPWTDLPRKLTVQALRSIVIRFGVKSEQRQVNNVRARGYTFGALKMVFDHYL